MVVIVDGEEAGLSFEYILGKIFIPLVRIKVTKKSKENFIFVDE